MGVRAGVRGVRAWRARARRDWWARLRCPWAVAGTGQAPKQRAEPDNSDPAPLVWRAPEGPEGTGGLRGAAPNEVRSPSLAGGRALRRPKHPWSHKQQAGRPPPTGTQSDQTEPGRLCAVDGGRTEPPGLTQHAAPETPVEPQATSRKAAAHRHTERPDRTRQIMRSGRRAHRAARPDTTRGARNTRGATSNTINEAGRRLPAHAAARPNEAGHAARTARGRAAAHGHTKQPGPTRVMIRRLEVWRLV